MKDHEGIQVYEEPHAPEPVQPDLEILPDNPHHPLVRNADANLIEKPTVAEALPRSRRQTRRAGLPPLTFWLGIGVIAVLAVGIVIAGVLGGTGVQRQKSKLQECQRQLNTLPTSVGGGSSPNNSCTNTTTPTGNTTVPGETYSSTCSSLQTWRSNLTDQSYTQVCNADISHWNVQFDLVAGAIVDNFDACVVMCDALNWNWAYNISVVAWSWSGNSSTGIQANPDGKCWCIQTYDGGYSMNTTLGNDCFLRNGTYDASTIGTIVNGS